MNEKFYSYPTTKRHVSVFYSFQYESPSGKWLTYLPYHWRKQDALMTRDLVAERGLKVGDIIEMENK